MSTVGDLFTAWLENIPADGPWPRSQIKLLVCLDERLPNVLEDHSVTYDGLSWRPGVPYGTFILKARVNNVASVCFVNARTISGALGIFLRMLVEERVPWKRDKYAQT